MKVEQAKERDSFEEILRKYKRAWETRNPNEAVTLFTSDATYKEDPFNSKPLRGLREIHDYWAKVPKYQKKIKFDYWTCFPRHLKRVGFRVESSLYKNRNWGSDPAKRSLVLRTVWTEDLEILGVLAYWTWKNSLSTLEQTFW